MQVIITWNKVDPVHYIHDPSTIWRNINNINESENHVTDMSDLISCDKDTTQCIAGIFVSLSQIYICPLSAFYIMVVIDYR